MLVTSILGKLPVETRQNLARAHGSDEWTTSDLQHAMLNEIRILEMRIRDNQQAPQLPTASFLTNTHKQPPQTRERRSTTTSCVYCHRSHTSANCDTVKDLQQRLDIIKQDKLF